MKRRPVIIAYDISSPLRRRRVRRKLLAWRIDGQKSVHECLLDDREAEELYAQLSEMIEPETDHLLLAWLTPGEIEAHGTGQAETFFRRLLRAA